MLIKVLKIDLMILVALMLIVTKVQINTLIWVVVLSLGILGAKGGVFTLMSGGSYRVWGPGGYIAGNNEFALALIMAIPLMRYLQLQATNRWVKHGLSAMMLLSAAAALGSHSRGALLAIAAMSLYMWIKSPKKLGIGVALIVIGAALIVFMPENWTARMSTIDSYQEDASAMGRINAWWTAFNIALARVTGAGFDMYTYSIFSMYSPDPTKLHAAHSIYFQVLGEHGFIGLALFIGIWWAVWRTAGQLINHRTGDSDTQWCRQLGAMCQVSLAGYAVGGAFLSLAYFDLPYNVLVIVVATQRWLLDQAPTKGGTFVLGSESVTAPSSAKA